MREQKAGCRDKHRSRSKSERSRRRQLERRSKRSSRSSRRVRIAAQAIEDVQHGNSPSSEEVAIDMAKTRALVKRRKAVRNIRKITRTMELIATARFKKAMDRASRGGGLHAQDRRAGRRPAAPAPAISRIRCWRSARRSRTAVLLVLTSNRGLCGGYNAGDPAAGDGSACAKRAGAGHQPASRSCPASGPSTYFRFQGIPAEQTYTQFEDKPTLRRGGGAGQPLHRGCTSPARSTGSTWRT